MNRRTVLRNLVIIAGGAIFIPSCLSRDEDGAVKLTNFKLGQDQEELLATVAGVIIPKTTTPGAREVDAHLYVLKMLDDCHEKEDQQAFLKGMAELDKLCKQKHGTSFVKTEDKKQLELLQEIAKDTSSNKDLQQFYKIMKSRTIQGYMTSKHVIKDIQKYEMVPTVQYDGYHRIENAI